MISCSFAGLALNETNVTGFWGVAPSTLNSLGTKPIAALASFPHFGFCRCFAGSAMTLENGPRLDEDKGLRRHKPSATPQPVTRNSPIQTSYLHCGKARLTCVNPT